MAQKPEEAINPEEVYRTDKKDSSSEFGPVGAQQVGALLRHTRKEKGLSIDDMSQRTRIRDVYLIAMEAGEVEKLPGTAFIAGFMRLYAKNLDLNLDNSLVERFLADFENRHQNLTTENFSPPAKSRQRPNSGAVLGGIIGLVALSMAYGHFLEGDGQGEQQLPTSPPLKVGEVAPASAQRLKSRPEADKSVSNSDQSEVLPSESQQPIEDELPEIVEEFPEDEFPEEDLPEIKVAAKESQRAVIDKPVREIKKPELAKLPVAVDKSFREPQELVVLWPRAIVVSPSSEATQLRANPAPVMVPDTAPVLAPVLDKPIDSFESQPVKPRKKEAEVIKEDAKLTPRQRIVNRYPESMAGNKDPEPEASNAVSLISRELVWVQIRDDEGVVLKDMVMQPGHLFRVPVGMPFFATLGNAGGVQLRVGKKKIPFLGAPGEVIEELELSAANLLKQAAKT